MSKSGEILGKPQNQIDLECDNFISLLDEEREQIILKINKLEKKRDDLMKQYLSTKPSLEAIHKTLTPQEIAPQESKELEYLRSIQNDLDKIYPEATVDIGSTEDHLISASDKKEEHCVFSTEELPDPDSSDDEGEQKIRPHLHSSPIMPEKIGSPECVLVHRGIHFSDSGFADSSPASSFNKINRIYYRHDFYKTQVSGSIPSLFAPKAFHDAKVPFMNALSLSDEQLALLEEQAKRIQLEFEAMEKKDLHKTIFKRSIYKVDYPEIIHTSLNLDRALQYGFGEVIANNKLTPDYDGQGKPLHPYLGVILSALIPTEEYEKIHAAAVIPLINSKEVKSFSTIPADNEVMVPAKIDKEHIAYIDLLKLPDFSKKRQHPFSEEYAKYFQNKYGLDEKDYLYFKRKITNAKNDKSERAAIAGDLIKHIRMKKAEKIESHLKSIAHVVYPAEKGFVEKPVEVEVKKRSRSNQGSSQREPSDKSKKHKEKRKKRRSVQRNELALDASGEISLKIVLDESVKAINKYEYAVTLEKKKETKHFDNFKIISQDFSSFLKGIENGHFVPLSRRNKEDDVIHAHLFNMNVFFRINYLEKYLQNIRREGSADSLLSEFKVADVKTCYSHINKELSDLHDHLTQNIYLLNDMYPETITNVLECNNMVSPSWKLFFNKGKDKMDHSIFSRSMEKTIAQINIIKKNLIEPIIKSDVPSAQQQISLSSANQSVFKKKRKTSQHLVDDYEETSDMEETSDKFVKKRSKKN